MLRTTLALGLMTLAMGVAACTVEGEDVATTFFDPTPTGNPPTSSGNPTSGATDDPPPDTEEDTADPSESADTGDNTSSATTNTTMMGESSGGMPANEQPDFGMYSECGNVGDCIGLTTCVIVPGAEGGGFCSNTGCGNPGADCDANPGATSTAPPDCIDDGTGALVCALSCAGGQSCPGGMQCLPVGVTMVCA